ncbi:hypothetical protein [Pseudonocardia hydrocarbonoxydans]|uniref:hypothetical protein n=1 Tax=Pseudonocardia hydrocarbonoxydans TaxID=76726 RepID=UPI0031D80C01
MHDTMNTTTARRAVARVQQIVWTMFMRFRPAAWEAVDERGGGRNSDEGMHIGAGAVIAGTIAAGIAAFVANRLGVLGAVR